MPTAATTDPVTLGYVSRPNGLQGAVVVHTDPTMSSVFAKGLEVELRPRSGAPIRTAVAGASRVSDGVRIKFEGVSDRSAAEALVGATIVVERGVLGPMDEGEYLDTDLIGLEVVTREGKVLGRVVEVVATGANDVYVVSTPTGELLLPAISTVILNIDVATKKITAHVMEGLR